MASAAIFLLLIAGLHTAACQTFKPNPNQRSLVTLWTFDEAPGTERVSLGPYHYKLHEDNGPIERADEGVFNGTSAFLRPGQRFVAPRAQVPALDFHGRVNLTVIAWLNRMPYCGFSNYSDHNPYPCCEFVAGVFNESAAARQYGLFMNLHSFNSSNQADGLVSAHGGNTPGHDGCVTGAFGATPVPYFRWSCVGMTYDGNYVRGYYNGKLDRRTGLNPFPYDKGIYDGGSHGADFTVGSNSAFGQKHNYVYGMIGGVAIYNATLTDEEVSLVCGYTGE
ncbi:uncharacterized protein [Oscarella lobularis]|uniref:uncharacterized protein n=1 Tax=Oscarella lobularis TaxID=121494 RepID=UPI003313EE69